MSVADVPCARLLHFAICLPFYSIHYFRNNGYASCLLYINLVIVGNIINKLIIHEKITLLFLFNCLIYMKYKANIISKILEFMHFVIAILYKLIE